MNIKIIEGRNYRIAKSANGVAMLNFPDLSKDNLGVADFIAICRNFHTIFLKNVPKITMNDRDSARRFILLVINCFFSL